MKNLGAIGNVMRVSEPKTETPLGGLSSSSSKTNGTRGIKVSNLEASGHAVLALKNKLRQFRHFFFLHWDFRDALRRKSLCFIRQFYEVVNKNIKRYNFETAKGRNLKFRSYLGHA